MTVKYFDGFVGNELPNVPSGYRTVEATVGRKWVRVREALPWPTKRRKIPHEIWETLDMKPRSMPRYLIKKRKKGKEKK
jgi:hypothetical protein|tara:strand:+ start:3562 stop:3798 length:237 start_codon:yes stop_codon:yes gene_type:complete